VNEAAEGVFVCLLLYRTDLLVCERLRQIFGILAVKFPHTKFVQSVAQSCIPNYPDKNLPTVFIYQSDDLKTQFIGPEIFGGEAMTPEGGRHPFFLCGWIFVAVLCCAVLCCAVICDVL
jgi:hypothetical protein